MNLNLKANKTLGQNFLKSESALNKIIETGKVSAEDFVLEIGPGQGALTEKLLGARAKVLAIEKDPRMIKFLQQKFVSEIKSSQLVLKAGDILEINPEDVPEIRAANFEYKLIANIPYYITGEILRKFLSTNRAPNQMVLLVQKEVAKRITEEKSLLSISVKAYSKPYFVQTVKAGSFVPAPKVDSAIISLEEISKEFFEKHRIDDETFFKIVRAGFAHKRKKLLSNLKKTFKIEPEKIENIFDEIELKYTARPEELNIDQWGIIVNKIKAFLI
jgi:16S rRNA (adenine1518-N6/adenine1519-N6)-dimethyltransferase